MDNFSTVLGQMIAIVPRYKFQAVVDRYGGDRYTKKFNCWSQFVCMLYAQLASRRSLRDLERNLAVQEKHSYHLAVHACKRNTLANANKKRNWQMYRDVFIMLLERCAMASSVHGFRFKNRLYSMDATVVDLCLGMFSWAAFRSSKGGIKVHTVLDHNGGVPHFAVVTEAKMSDISAGRKMKFAPGSILAVDRGYVDYAWFYSLESSGVYFVTRLKKNALHRFVKVGKCDLKAGVLGDDEIVLTGARGEKYQKRLRLVRFFDSKTARTYAFLTNIFHLCAKTIADIYKSRWNIELFFKAIKQNLKVKRFLGTSENAVITQVWMALIAYLLAAYLKFKSRCKLSTGEVLRLLQLNLFDRRDVSRLLNFIEDPPYISNRSNSQLEFALL